MDTRRRCVEHYAPAIRTRMKFAAAEARAMMVRVWRAGRSTSPAQSIVGRPVSKKTMRVSRPCVLPVDGGRLPVPASVQVRMVFLVTHKVDATRSLVAVCATKDLVETRAN